MLDTIGKSCGDKATEPEINEEEVQQISAEVEGNDKEDGDNIFGRPCVGMEFDSRDEAYHFYNHYAGRLGFSVRKNSTYRSRISNEISGRTFCCSLEGSRGSKCKRFESRTRNVADTRTGCKAMMGIWKNKDSEKWDVTQVVEAHNHPLVTPSKRYLLRSQRKMEPAQKKMAEDMRSVGIRTSLMVDFLASEAGGVQNVGFTRKDVNNYLNAKRQKALAVGDAQALLDHLQKQQLDNPAFSYSIQVDSDGRMTNFFWADARSRIDYQHFGDVVCFDPTYGTNKYDMPFVPIVGVNHHSQTVLFGGALLYSETEESFAWVMRTWMNAMNEKQPKVILTDQESAIGGAVRQVLPDCRHRYCLWHIGRNGIKHLAHEINTQKQFWKDFNDCLYDYETIEEFENGWNQMLEKYNLVENKWLKALFEKREKWASVYARDIFCGGMYTTQRSESINSYFDKYLKKGLPLFEFMKQYERAVVDRREAENKADFDTYYRKPILRVFMEIEKEGANVYTKEIFCEFQEQVFQSLSYRHRKIDENDIKKVYNVWKEGHEQVARTVEFEPATKSAKCSCQLFEFAGYFCRHVLKVFMVEDVYNIPAQYILKRWTKDAKAGSLVANASEEILVKSGDSVTSRYCRICQEGVNIASKASPYVEVFNIAMEGLTRTLRDVEIALKSLSLDSNLVQSEQAGSDRFGETSASHVQVNIQKPLLDPPIKKHKGRDHGRKLPWFEKGGKKTKNISKKASRGGRRKQALITDQSKSRLSAIDEDVNSELNHEKQLVEPGHVFHSFNGYSLSSSDIPSNERNIQAQNFSQVQFIDRFHHHLNDKPGYQPYPLNNGAGNQFENLRQDYGGGAIDLNEVYDFS